MRLSSLALAAMTVAASTVAYAHDHWINAGGYRSPVTKELCCGPEDCFVIGADKVMPLDGGAYAIKGLETVPRSEVQWSEDGQYWRCQRGDGTRRCFFAPSLGF